MEPHERRRTDRLRARLGRDVLRMGLPTGPRPRRPVAEVELDSLPGPARRYLEFMGVVGRVPDWSFEAHATGRFRLRPSQAWMRCESWQYNSAIEVARVFQLRAEMAGGLSLWGRDTYWRGRGVMEGTLLRLVPVARSTGWDADVSELVTYLNDAVLFAPSTLLRLPVEWGTVDERAFRVTLVDRGHQVSATVEVDGQGAPIEFSTEDRFVTLDSGTERARWSTPVDGWRHEGGRVFPARASAVWHLSDGPFAYAELEFGTGAVVFDVDPAEVFGAHGGVRPRVATRVGALRNWGATAEERAAVLPGDELVGEPADTVTRAVTVEAPAAEVWSWLVQIGQDRGGLYSYDWLENAFGLHVHSAHQVRDEWQHLGVGDRVRLVPKGWLGLEDGLALPVVRLDPGRDIVLREEPPDQPWDAVWSFHVVPEGPDRCRLVSRSRGARAGALARVAGEVMEPVTLLMTRRMLLGIKERAEAGARLGGLGHEGRGEDAADDEKEKVVPV